MMFHLRSKPFSFEIMNNYQYKFHITLQKMENYLTLASNDPNIYSEFVLALKNFCVLENFTQNYELLQFLGAGHFADVYLAKNKITDQLFAAKIIKKKDEKFIHNKVLSIFFLIF